MVAGRIDRKGAVSVAVSAVEFIDLAVGGGHESEIVGGADGVDCEGGVQGTVSGLGDGGDLVGIAGADTGIEVV